MKSIKKSIKKIQIILDKMDYDIEVLKEKIKSLTLTCGVEYSQGQKGK